jgi:hypothetical protein
LKRLFKDDAWWIARAITRIPKSVATGLISKGALGKHITGSRDLETETDEAMKALTALFSDPQISTRAQFRCAIEGPTEIDILWESALSDVFGDDAGSVYRHWVSRLYRLGFVSRIPADWDGPEAKDK